MAHKITHLHSPADSKVYPVAKSKGAPKTAPAGHAPTTQKSYPFPTSKGEARGIGHGLDKSKKFPIRANKKAR